MTRRFTTLALLSAFALLATLSAGVHAALPEVGLFPSASNGSLDVRWSHLPRSGPLNEDGTPSIVRTGFILRLYDLQGRVAHGQVEILEGSDIGGESPQQEYEYEYRGLEPGETYELVLCAIYSGSARVGDPTRECTRVRGTARAASDAMKLSVEPGPKHGTLRAIWNYTTATTVDIVNYRLRLFDERTGQVAREQIDVDPDTYSHEYEDLEWETTYRVEVCARHEGDTDIIPEYQCDEARGRTSRASITAPTLNVSEGRAPGEIVALWHHLPRPHDERTGFILRLYEDVGGRRGPPASEQTVLAESENSFSKTYTGLVPGRRYHLTVCAIYDTPQTGDRTRECAQGSAIAGRSGDPPTITGSEGTAPGSLQVTWTYETRAPDGVALFRLKLYRDASGRKGAFVKSNTVTGDVFEYTYGGLEEGASYHVEICAVLANTEITTPESQCAETGRIQTKLANEKLTLLAEPGGEPGSIEATWSYASDRQEAHRFRLRLYRDERGRRGPIAREQIMLDPNIFRHEYTGLEPNGRYQLEVCAMRAGDGEDIRESQCEEAKPVYAQGRSTNIPEITLLTGSRAGELIARWHHLPRESAMRTGFTLELREHDADKGKPGGIAHEQITLGASAPLAHTYTGLTPGGRYHLTVCALYGTPSASSATSECSYSTSGLAGAIEAPPKLRLDAGRLPGSLRALWIEETGASPIQGFELQLYEDRNGRLGEIANAMVRLGPDARGYDGYGENEELGDDIPYHLELCTIREGGSRSCTVEGPVRTRDVAENALTITFEPTDEVGVLRTTWVQSKTARAKAIGFRLYLYEVAEDSQSHELRGSQDLPGGASTHEWDDLSPSKQYQVEVCSLYTVDGPIYECAIEGPASPRAPTVGEIDATLDPTENIGELKLAWTHRKGEGLAEESFVFEIDLFQDVDGLPGEKLETVRPIAGEDGTVPNEHLYTGLDTETAYHVTICAVYDIHLAPERAECATVGPREPRAPEPTADPDFERTIKEASALLSQVELTGMMTSLSERFRPGSPQRSDRTRGNAWALAEALGTLAEGKPDSTFQASRYRPMPRVLESGRAWATWVRADRGSAEHEIESNRYDMRHATIHGGVETAFSFPGGHGAYRSKWTAGLGVGATQGTLDYRRRASGRGSMESQSWLLYPYLGFTSPRRAGYAAVGMGTGRIDVTDTNRAIEFLTPGRPRGADRRTWFTAAGMKFALNDPDATIGLTFGVDAGLARTKTDGIGLIEPWSETLHQLKAGLGARTSWQAGAAILTPSLETALAHHGGDSVTGGRWENEARLELQAGAFSLAAHGTALTGMESGSGTAWRTGLAARIAAGPRGHGLSLSLDPSIGWEEEPHSDPDATLRAELGYGLGLSIGRRESVLTPYVTGRSEADDTTAWGAGARYRWSNVLQSNIEWTRNIRERNDPDPIDHVRITARVEF